MSVRVRIFLVALMAALALSACNLGAPAPTAAPTNEPLPPAPTPQTPEATEEPTDGGPVAGFEQAVKDAVAAQDTEQMALLMADPFTIGYWLSEGTVQTPAEAAALLTENYMSADHAIVFPETHLTFEELLGGDPGTFWGPDANVASMLYSAGWSTDGTGEAIIVITEQPDGTFTWFGMLLAPTGFTPVEVPDAEGLNVILASVQDAITARDFEALALLMADPFNIALWRSEGVEMTPIEAANEITSTRMAPDAVIVFPETHPDLRELLGSDPNTFLGPDKEVVTVLYSAGWGDDGEGEALLFFTRQPDGAVGEANYRIVFDTILFAPDGFN